MTIREAISSVTFGKPPHECAWLSPSGEVIRCDNHLQGAIRILKNLKEELIEEDDAGTLYDALYDREYVRVAIKKDKIDYSHGRALPSKKQLDALKALGGENRLPVLDELGALLWTPDRAG